MKYNSNYNRSIICTVAFAFILTTILSSCNINEKTAETTASETEITNENRMQYETTISETEYSLETTEEAEQSIDYALQSQEIKKKAGLFVDAVDNLSDDFDTIKRKDSRTDILLNQIKNSKTAYLSTELIWDENHTHYEYALVYDMFYSHFINRIHNESFDENNPGVKSYYKNGKKATYNLTLNSVDVNYYDTYDFLRISDVFGFDYNFDCKDDILCYTATVDGKEYTVENSTDQYYFYDSNNMLSCIVYKYKNFPVTEIINDFSTTVPQDVWIEPEIE